MAVAGHSEAYAPSPMPCMMVPQLLLPQAALIRSLSLPKLRPRAPPSQSVPPLLLPECSLPFVEEVGMWSLCRATEGESPGPAAARPILAALLASARAPQEPLVFSGPDFDFDDVAPVVGSKDLEDTRDQSDGDVHHQLIKPSPLMMTACQSLSSASTRFPSTNESSFDGWEQGGRPARPCGHAARWGGHVWHCDSEDSFHFPPI